MSAEVNPATVTSEVAQAERSGRTMLELRNLVMRFGGVTALREVDLTIKEGRSSRSSVRTAPARPRCSTW